VNRWAVGALWIGVYLAFSLSPLLFVMLGERPPGRDFWTELSVGLGFVGLAMLGLQFAITARFRRVAAPYGIDIILQFHRQISLFAFAIIFAHPIILFVVDPENLALLNLIDAPWRARFGVGSLLALAAIIVTSIWREALRLRYEVWRALHAVLALVAVAFALFHILGVGYYISLPWMQGLWIFMTAGTVVLLLWIRLVKPLRMLSRPYRIEGVEEERGESWTVTLRPEDGKPTPFQPGQFAWLTMRRNPFGFEEHPFSYSSSARTRDSVSFTIKELGDFTSKIGELEPGERAYIDGPYGAFTNERYEAPGFVFLAGGVGITPVMSMLRTLADWEDLRPLLLIFGNKTLEEATFLEELEALEERLNLTVVHVLEEPHEGWEGESGFVDADLVRRHVDEEQIGRRRFFVCGPNPMMDAVEEALDEVGVPNDRVLTERFDLV
jgi:predicted ferric reductase